MNDLINIEINNIVCKEPFDELYKEENDLVQKEKVVNLKQRKIDKIFLNILYKRLKVILRRATKKIVSDFKVVNLNFG